VLREMQRLLVRAHQEQRYSLSLSIADLKLAASGAPSSSQVSQPELATWRTSSCWPGSEAHTERARQQPQRGSEFNHFIRQFEFARRPMLSSLRIHATVAGWCAHRITRLRRYLRPEFNYTLLVDELTLVFPAPGDPLRSSALDHKPFSPRSIAIPGARNPCTGASTDWRGPR